MRILLVASSNGLGHARRLLNLTSGLHALGFDPRLAITKRQADHLDSEIKEMRRSFACKLLQIDHHGLEAKLFQSVGAHKPISSETKKAVAEADLILSDNSLWPASYNPNFFLLGHFEWLTYVKLLPKAIQQPIMETDAFRIEKRLIEQSLGWFKTKHFSMENELLNPIALEVPLPRYSKDPSYQRIRSDAVWASWGTTNRNALNTNRPKLFGHQVLTRETWEMSSSNQLPLAVLGRPGFGTIRDCLASGTPFIPSWQGEDPELASNETTLKRLGLSLEFRLEEGSRLGNLKIKIEATSYAIERFWTQNSATPTEIAKQIMKTVGNLELK